MVTLSMGVLQCNLLANVSTVAGELYSVQLWLFTVVLGSFRKDPAV